MKKFFVQLIFKKIVMGQNICAMCDMPFDTYAAASEFANEIKNPDIYAAEVCVQYAPPPPAREGKKAIEPEVLEK